MDKASYFVENKALFGGYPNQNSVEEYENNGVRYFINLTEDGEKGIEPYKTNYIYIHYPIIDRQVPKDWKSFSIFIIKVADIIKNLDDKEEKLFLSCKGGHGRSGVVVACLLSYMYKIDPSDAIKKTCHYHSLRKNMRDKWRKIGSPQTTFQKNFVMKFFDNLYIYNNKLNFSSGIRYEYNLQVDIPNIGLFPNLISAYYALKNPSNNTYIKSLQTYTDFLEIDKLFKEEKETEDWEKNKELYLYTVLKYAFEQYPIIKEYLINTGFRNIILCSSDLVGTHSKNIFGEVLMNIRKNIYISSENF
jgi:hypothetical protein